MQKLEYGSQREEFIVVFTMEEFNELIQRISNLYRSSKETLNEIEKSKSDSKKLEQEIEIGRRLNEEFFKDICQSFTIETPSEREQRKVDEWYGKTVESL